MASTSQTLQRPALSARSRSFAGLTALVFASSMSLTACSGSSDQPDVGEQSPTDGAAASQSPTAAAIPESDVEVPPTVTITPPGTSLEFGETASVTFENKTKGTVLDLSVRSAAEGSIKDFTGFDLKDPLKRKANYFYVRVKVDNSGTQKFGGYEVPLWGLSGANTLLPPVRFTAAFPKCPTENVPKKFKAGDTFKTCLVFLSPDGGTLEGVTFRPTETYNPIEWTGEVEKPNSGKNKESKKNKK